MEINRTDRYEAEIDSMCNVWPTVLLGKPAQLNLGKNKVELSGAELMHLMTYVETEIEDYQRIQKAYTKAYEKREKEASLVKEDDGRFWDRHAKWLIEEKPEARFQREFDRPLMPFRSIKVLKNLGPIVNNQTLMAQNRDFVNAIVAMHNQAQQTKGK